MQSNRLGATALLLGSVADEKIDPADYSFAVKRRGGGRYTAPVKLYRSNARQSFLKVWLRRPKRVRRLSRTCWRSDQREDMRLNELNYKIYRASKGEVSFSRWEVFHKNRRTVPLKSGFIYGTMADARIRASDAMSKLADTGKAQTKRVAPPGKGSSCAAIIADLHEPQALG